MMPPGKGDIDPDPPVRGTKPKAKEEEEEEEKEEPGALVSEACTKGHVRRINSVKLTLYPQSDR